MPGNDLREFVTLSKPRRLACGVKTALSQLKPAQRRLMVKAMAVDSNLITHTAISEWAAKRGVKVHADTISRHRRKVCSCD